MAPLFGVRAPPRLRLAFQMPVELLAEASSKKNFYMRFYLANCVTRVLLLRKSYFSEKYIFLQIITFFQLLFCRWFEKQSLLTQITTLHKYSNRLLIRKANFCFSKCFLCLKVYIFANYHFFPVTFLPVVRKTISIDSNNNSPQIFQ